MAMFTTALNAASESFLERAALEAAGPFVAAVVGAGVIGYILKRIERKHEERLRQREVQARNDALRHELVTMMTDCASSWFLATQRYQRVKGEVDDQPPHGRAPTKKEQLRDELDEQYVKNRALGQALEYRLGGYFACECPRQLWHRVQDLLTVIYFDVTDRLATVPLEKYRGAGHTGLSEQQLRDQGEVTAAYHRTMHEAVENVFATALADRSGSGQPKPCPHSASHGSTQR